MLCSNQKKVQAYIETSQSAGRFFQYARIKCNSTETTYICVSMRAAHFLVVDIRLGYVQFALGNMLTERAKDSWSRNIKFEPERGRIFGQEWCRACNE
ncbi:hypothetical protein GCM10020331_045540 [Ectobacillus funiculus]